MKRIVPFIFLLAFTLTISAQKPFVMFGHVPSDLFTNPTVDRDIRASGVFLWSLDAVVSGAEITLNKEANTFETAFLSGVGAAIGYKNHKLLPDGSIVSNFGVNVALLTKVKLNEIVDTRMKLALLANVYNFTLGPVYTFGDNKIGLLVGANLSF